MAIYQVNDLVMNSLVEETNKDIIVMGVCVSCGECQQVEFLEEFLSRLRSLMQKRQLVLGIGFLVCVLEGFLTLLSEIRERSPAG